VKPPPDILSFVSELGRRSETWLYRQLLAPHKHKILVCTGNYINRSEYPYSPVVGAPVLWPRIVNHLRRYCKLPPKNWVQLRRRMFKKALSSRDVRLIQGHFGWTSYEVWGLVRREAKPFIVWLYGSDVFRKGWGREDRLPFLFQTRIRFACSSNALRDEAIRLGCNPSKIKVIYPGIPIPNYSGGRTAATAPLRIVSVGRLVDFKAPLGLVEMGRHLRGLGVQFEWNHIGDGPLRVAMEREIREAELEGAFTLHGEVSNSGLSREMAAAHLMIHNAQIAPNGGRESFGVVLAEAAAAGLPVVSCRVGGIPEVVIHRQTGFLVPAGEYRQAAAYAAKFVREPQLLREMGQRAHEHAKLNFNAEVQGRKLDSFYDEVLREEALPRNASSDNTVPQPILDRTFLKF
jgi:glycosyltransferase involved in cell wall biosynthesis